MKIKTSELTGAALDWSVAKASGESVYLADIWNVNGEYVQKIKLSEYTYWGPSTNWSQCGPLIETYITTLNKSDDNQYWCHAGDRLGEGCTPLIAACRAIVASQLGDEVDVPEELT